MVDADHLVGTEEIARRLDVANRYTVHQWRKRDVGFPAPLVVVDRTMVWYWPDVEEWARATGRMPYRKPPRPSPPGS